MKLNRNTKFQVEAGDLLRFGNGDEYIVENIIGGSDRVGSRSALSFTICDTKDKRVIYGCPSSQLYGAEIVKGEN